MKKEDFLNTVDINIFKDYYNHHSTNELCKYFGLYKYQIDEILSILDIPKHTKEVDSRIAVRRRKETCLERYGDETYNNPEKNRQTCLEHFGVDNASKAESIKEKKRQTCLTHWGVGCSFQAGEVKEKSRASTFKHFGVEYSLQSEEIREKAKQTLLKNLGVDNASKSKEVREKTKLTNNKKYGVDYVFQAEEVKEKIAKTNLKKYGNEKIGKVDWVHKAWADAALTIEARQKARKTTRENSSYGISKPEERTFEKLIEIFGNVEREYKEDRYLYFCDFYIPERDMFIEYNGFWTHNTHWYDKNSEEDRNHVKLWESRDNVSSWYKAAIYNWTVRDAEKRETARKNNLNYVVFWNEDDVDKWIAEGCPDRQDWR